MAEWSLPFSERYHWLRRGIPDLLREMDGQRRQIAAERQRLSDNQRRLKRYWRAWCHLQVEDADQLESLLAHYDAVRAAMDAARSQPAPGEVEPT